MLRVPLAALVLLGAACGPTSPPMKPIEFLTREGCVQTTVMRARLDEAIQGLPVALTYAVVDLDALPGTDVRKAYPTPTILYGGTDLFGMAEPRPPFDEPT